MKLIKTAGTTYNVYRHKTTLSRRIQIITRIFYYVIVKEIVCLPDIL